MQGILIVYNSCGDREDPLYPSRAGVLDEVDAVAQALDMLGIDYEVLEADSLRQLLRYINHCDEKLVFNLVEEFSGFIEEAAYVPAVCESFGKGVTGSGSSSLLLCQNKMFARSVLAGASLPVAEAVCVFGSGQTANLPAKGRYIVKPILCDAGEGISAASVVVLPFQIDQTRRLIDSLISKFGCGVIIERFLDGREFNVSILQRDGKPEIAAVAEIDFAAFGADMPRIVDYDAKWIQDSFAYKNTPRILAPDLEPELLDEIERISLGSWKVCGCRDYIRVDIRTDHSGRPFILEVNPNPDISPEGGFAAALEYAGIGFEEFVEAMLSNASSRQNKLKGSTNER